MPLLVDMLLFAADSYSPVTIVLITGDRDYMYAVSRLMHRRHKVVVIAPSVASNGLKSIASEFHDWDAEIVGPARSAHLGLGDTSGGGGHAIGTTVTPPTPLRSKGADDESVRLC